MLSTLGMASLFKYSHSMGYTSHYGFNLHFPNSSQCLDSFHMLICYTYILFGEEFVQNIFLRILWCYLVFSQLHFESSSYFFNTSFFFSEICFENIFPICGLSFHSQESYLESNLSLVKSTLSSFLPLMYMLVVSKELVFNPSHTDFLFNFLLRIL